MKFNRCVSRVWWDAWRHSICLSHFPSTSEWVEMATSFWRAWERKWPFFFVSLLWCFWFILDLFPAPRWVSMSFPSTWNSGRDGGRMSFLFLWLLKKRRKLLSSFYTFRGGAHLLFSHVGDCLIVCFPFVFVVSFRLVFSGTTECLWRKRKQPHMTDERIQRRRIIWFDYIKQFHGIKVKGLQPQTVHHRAGKEEVWLCDPTHHKHCECLPKKWRTFFEYVKCL